MGSKGSSNGSTKAERILLDLERDLSTTAEDVRVLQELRTAQLESALVHAYRMLAPGWILERAASQPLFEGFPPFAL